MGKEPLNDFDTSELEDMLTISKILKVRSPESRARILIYEYNFFKPSKEDLNLPEQVIPFLKKKKEFVQ